VTVSLGMTFVMLAVFVSTALNPLIWAVSVFQAAGFCALVSSVAFLLHGRGQKPTSFANRGGNPIAGKFDAIRTYWRIASSNSYSASLFSNTGRHAPIFLHCRLNRTYLAYQ
jgi:hypothetical protein